MKLTGNEAYLILKTSDSRQKVVQISSSLSEALSSWNSRDRVSPVFEVESEHSITSPFSFSKSKSFLLFLGPVNPADADICLSGLRSQRARAWLTFGLFDVLLYTESATDVSRIVKWAGKRALRWEKWTLRGSKVAGVENHNQRQGARPSALLNRVAELPFSNASPELRDAGEEYCTLIAAAATRSFEVDVKITEELEQSNSIILQEALKRKAGRGLPAISLLVDANAALSRFTSQAFSGISPINETECHFWTHSLLGTGVANLALLNIRRFISKRLGEARIADQVGLFSLVTDATTVREVHHEGQIWNGPWLHRLPEAIGRTPLFSDLAVLAPLITYLSGRDGFHTTLTTLSAPLNILRSCNSVRWSLLTVTHEMSHRVIDGALGFILPDPSNSGEMSAAASLLNEESQPSNLLECLRFRVLQTMAELEENETQADVPDKFTERQIRDLMGRRREDVEEVMVHVFDFLYFYGEAPETYVPAIWHSWDAIPGLYGRIPRYVLRTLCAVYTKSWSSTTATQDAIAAVRAGMERVVQSDKHNAYIHDSLKYLDLERENLQTRLQRRRPLIGVVRTFLQSPPILQNVRGQVAKKSFQGLTFDGTTLENPLRFIEENTSGQGNIYKSFWMLVRLAFDVAETQPLRLDGVNR